MKPVLAFAAAQGTAKTYATRDNAVKAVVKRIEEIRGVYPDKDTSNLHYLIIATENGRFMPLVIGPFVYSQDFVQNGFCHLTA